MLGKPHRLNNPHQNGPPRPPDGDLGDTLANLVNCRTHVKVRRPMVIRPHDLRQDMSTQQQPGQHREQLSGGLAGRLVKQVTK